MLKRLHILLIAIMISVLPIGCRSNKLLIDEEYNAVYVSCFSYYVRGENITMTVGFGKETPDYFQMFTIRDGGEKKTKIEEEVNEEYCKISFNGNKGIYEKRYI